MTTPFTPHLVIGIAGKAGHGKDAVASILSKKLNELGQLNNIIRFADALKDAYSIMFSIDRDKLEELDFKLQKNEITGTTHRQELQFLGTEAYRTRTGNPDVWVQVLCARLQQYYGGGISPVLIPDVRFENEARFCVQNGLLLKVERPGQKETVNSGHVSEAGFTTLPHMTITNDGSLADLETKCDEAVKLILLKYGTYKLGIKEVKMRMFM